MFPQFLMILTLITGGAFADNKGHVCIEEKGAKECVVGMLEQRTGVPLLQEEYNNLVND